MKELTTAPDREVEELEDATGIYVRARFTDGTFGTVDIASWTSRAWTTGSAAGTTSTGRSAS